MRAALVPTGTREPSDDRGEATIYDVEIAGRTAPGAARRYHDSPVEELRELVRIVWNAMHD